jgi:hypothetical protein
MLLQWNTLNFTDDAILSDNTNAMWRTPWIALVWSAAKGQNFKRSGVLPDSGIFSSLLVAVVVWHSLPVYAHFFNGV